MNAIAPLINVIQPYDWGSFSAIADFLGRPSPSPGPQAELWMGTHPGGPSRVRLKEATPLLSAMIAADKAAMLGRPTAERFNGGLPYLFKVLAAEKPLSIQAHPDLAQARAGFERENRNGVPLDAPERMFKDDNHKPECICALEPFWALNGFRPLPALLHRLERCARHSLVGERRALEQDPSEKSLRCFFHALLTLDEIRRGQVLKEVLDRTASGVEDDPVCRWVHRLNAAFPGDIGALFPLLLNLVRLAPGEAMYLPPRTLHAYLAGVGIELMANSDNVLRGGLTPKHVDVDGLTDMLHFRAHAVHRLQPAPRRPFEKTYPTPAEEFELSVIALPPAGVYQGPVKHSLEILLCTAGAVQAVDDAHGIELSVGRGAAFIVPACVRRYRLEGQGVLYKAGVPQ